MADPSTSRQGSGGGAGNKNNRHGRRYQGRDGNRAGVAAENFQGAFPDLEGFYYDDGAGDRNQCAGDQFRTTLERIGLHVNSRLASGADIQTSVINLKVEVLEKPKPPLDKADAYDKATYAERVKSMPNAWISWNNTSAHSMESCGANAPRACKSRWSQSKGLQRWRQDETVSSF